MNVQEMQKAVNDIVFSPLGPGLKAYACFTSGTETKAKLIVLSDDLQNQVFENMSMCTRSVFLGAEVELDSANNIADNKKILYEVEQSEDYEPFAFVDTLGSVTEQYSNDDRYALTGILFRINLNDDYIWLYQHVYQFSMVDQRKSILAVGSKDKIYRPIKNDVLRIDTRVDLLIIGRSIITGKVDLLQKYFKYDMRIRTEAEGAVSSIESMEILTDTTILSALITADKLTDAKKLMRAKNSPILKMRPDILVTRVRQHPRYKDKFLFSEDGKFEITTKKAAKEFLKLLNDDILRSDISDAEYDTSSKKALAPISP